jgi:hypothetical protein
MALRAIPGWLARITHRQRLLAAELLILVTALLLLFRYSPAAKASRNARACEQFGAALERAGIKTQAGPSR